MNRNQVVPQFLQIIVDLGAHRHNQVEMLRIRGGAAILGQEHAQVVAQLHEGSTVFHPPAVLGVDAHREKLTEVAEEDEPESHDAPPRQPLHEVLVDHADFVDNHHLVVEAVVHVAVHRCLAGDAAHLLRGHIGRCDFHNLYLWVALAKGLFDPRYQRSRFAAARPGVNEGSSVASDDRGHVVKLIVGRRFVVLSQQLSNGLSVVLVDDQPVLDVWRVVGVIPVLVALGACRHLLADILGDFEQHLTAALVPDDCLR